MSTKDKHIMISKDRESVLGRDSNYANNCKTGFTTGGGDFWEAHHILCIDAVASREVPDNKVSYLEACLWITDWNINNSSNMIGLPLNNQYIDSNGNNPINLPSHQVDHNTNDGFTQEVTDWLNDNVWNALIDKRKKHETNAEDIKNELKNGSQVFRTKINYRGTRKNGTLICWKNRFKKDYKEKWYYPFSMGANPRKRHPGISKANLNRIFKQI